MRSLAALLLILATPVLAQPCEPQWSRVSPTSGGFGTPGSVCTFDTDGNGPLPLRLFTNGYFVAGGQPAGLAMFDGSTWSYSSVGAVPANALLTFDADGPGPQAERLILGGGFSTIDGVPANRIAAFDGFSWTPLGGGLIGHVITLMSFDPDGPGPALPELLAGGSITQAGGVPAIGIARWTGGSWSPMEGLTSPSTVVDIALFDPDADGPIQPRVFISGNLTIGGIVCRLAHWTDQGWEVTPGMPSAEELTVFDPDGDGPASPMFIAGVRAGDPPPAVSAWNGVTWSPVGTGLAGVVYSLTVFDFDGFGPNPARLIAGGNLSLPGGITAHTAIWDGTDWSALPSPGGQVTSLSVVDIDGPGPEPEALYASSQFTQRVSRWGCIRLCPADWNADHTANSSDISAFLTAWLASVNGGTLVADFNTDGMTNSTDISAFLTAWLDAVTNGC